MYSRELPEVTDTVAEAQLLIIVKMKVGELDLPSGAGKVPLTVTV
jgi:hypothetical protein